MTHSRFLMKSWSIGSLLLVCGNVFAAGGTSVVARKGQTAYVSPSWPEKAGDLVNDPSRTSGWNSWFTEWPNDVNQYAFEIKSTDDLNRLIAKLAQIKTELRQIRLSHLKEPSSLGWVTRVPEGNGIPVVFSIGDQARIDEWYKHVRKPFGKMEFTAVPVAVPPTLTIFVQNQSVKLDELKIPKGIDLSMGYLPAVFHKFNTAMEREAEKKKTTSGKVERGFGSPKEKLDDDSLAAMRRIEAFLKSRESKASAEPDRRNRPN